MLFVLNLYGKYGIGLNKEEVMGYDYHVRMQEWDEVIAMAEKKAPDTPMSVSCLNLALAMKGQLPERMFSFTSGEGRTTDVICQRLHHSFGSR